MRRSSCLLLALLVLAGCAGEPEEHAATSGAASTTAATTPDPAPPADAVPVLLPEMTGAYSVDRADPPAVQRRKTQVQARAMRLLQQAATAPVDAAGGCVRDRPTLAADAGTPPLTWMVRRPEVVDVVVLGRQVQVDVKLPEQAASMACRVMGVTTNVTAGKDATFRNQVDEHWLIGRDELAGRTVRLVTELPTASAPPYELTVNTTTVTGARSAYEEIALECPRGGCLPPRDLTRPATATKERFAPAGVTTASLERSLLHILDGDPTWIRATSVACPTTTRCDVELADPVAEERVRTRFAMLGERRRGCWMAVVERTTRARESAIVTAPSVYGPLGGCVGWTR